MLLEFGITAKGSATYRTLTGFVSCVDSLVLPQLRAAPEAFPTLVTLIRLLPRVDSPVLRELGISAERFPTVMTLKWLLPRVDSPMCDIGGAAAKAIPTLFALVGLLPSMNAPMPAEAAIDTEGLPAHQAPTAVTDPFSTLHASEGLLAAVESLMPRQFCINAEGVATLLTLGGLLPCKAAVMGMRLRITPEGVHPRSTFAKPFLGINDVTLTKFRVAAEGSLQLCARRRQLSGASQLTPIHTWTLFPRAGLILHCYGNDTVLFFLPAC